MKATLGWALLTLLMYVLALTATLPAGVALRLMGVPGGLALSAVEGTLWSGRGRLHAAGMGGIPVRWETRPQALLSGCWSGQVDGQPRLAGHFELCGERLQARQVTARMPVGELLTLLELPPGAASGELQVRLESVAVSAERLNASGEILWRGASAGIGTRLAFGDITVQAVPQDRYLLLTTDHRSGDVGMSVQVQLSRTGTYRVSGTLIPLTSLAQRSGLELLGDRRTDGAIVLRQAGSLVF